MSDQDDIAALDERWRQAEVAGDTAALDAMATVDFRLVGPMGFVLDRSQWLARYGPEGGLTTTALEWREADVRVAGPVAIAIGIHDQRASYRGNPADGTFRSTHVYVRTDDGWRLAAVQLSPTGGPPCG